MAESGRTSYSVEGLFALPLLSRKSCLSSLFCFCFFFVGIAFLMKPSLRDKDRRSSVRKSGPRQMKKLGVARKDQFTSIKSVKFKVEARGFGLG